MASRFKFSWKLDAPPDAPAWYEQRNCLIRTTKENKPDILDVFLTQNIKEISHGAELLHELVHYVQDIGTGWGFYQSEIIAALAVAKLTTSSGVVQNLLDKFDLSYIPLNDRTPKLTGINPRELFSSSYSKLDELEMVWNSFFNRSHKFFGEFDVYEIDIIESCALAFQLIPHVFEKNIDEINKLLDGNIRDDPYIKALNFTAIAFGCENGFRRLDILLLVLIIHITLCELAFSVPPKNKTIQPVVATPQELAEIMPESLSKRFCRILDSAMLRLRPLMDDYLLSNDISSKRLQDIIKVIRGYTKWLHGVEICIGKELSERWMRCIQSPATYQNKAVNWKSDPLRLFRRWAMEYWNPFSEEFRFSPQGIFLKLMYMTPAFAISDGLESKWIIGAAQMNLKEHLSVDFDMMNWEESFERVSAYLDRQAVVYELSEYILTGEETQLPCPYIKNCKLVKNECHKSVAKGFIQQCRAYSQLDPFF